MQKRPTIDDAFIARQVGGDGCRNLDFRNSVLESVVSFASSSVPGSCLRAARSGDFGETACYEEVIG